MSTSIIEKTENLTQTRCLSAAPMVTHVKIGGVACAVWDLPKLHGFTYGERKQTLDQNSQISTHCRLGGVAISLEQFETDYPHIQLGQE